MLELVDSAQLPAALRAISDEVDGLFQQLLPVPRDGRARLYQAMRHAAIGGGKRMRPLLATASAALFGVERARSLRVGLAAECIHVYSLVHDDLPCMDDDDTRRGKPTVHKAYDEATAVLAGDSLHALAFALLADEGTHDDASVSVELVAALAHASGPSGMAGGQMMDLAAAETPLDIGAVTRLQQLKTGALIAFSVESGGMLGRAGAAERTALRGYAHDLGLAFQIADDLLDVSGDEAKAGKRLGKDEAQGKVTFVSLLGQDRAERQAAMLVEQAIEHLAPFGEHAALLREVARYAVERDR